MESKSQLEVDSKKRKTKKIARLLFLTGITAVVLIVETYAWFVGISSVSVDPFTIAVSAGEGLELSLDGVTWVGGGNTTQSLSISQTAITTGAYAGNTNKWVSDVGLIPVSTSGKVDTNSGRLIFYGKSSMTATAGGFRLITSQLNNLGSEGSQLVSEEDGYVVFDLFVRNGTGSNYVANYNEADDEGIYLTNDSKVEVSAAGSSGEDYGLANSARVAFVQIGRVASATANASQIQSINCTNTTTNTSLCDKVPTVIWEPNDKAHNSNLITYFNRICKNRDATGYLNTRCTTLADAMYVQTYTVDGAITSADQIDIYDGVNTFPPKDNKLVATDTFTDTEKAPGASGEAAEFFKLAANGVTKIRVYVYLEGQDIDNYDLISKGNAINVTFGFTKDRYGLIGS